MTRAVPTLGKAHTSFFEHVRVGRLDFSPQIAETQGACKTALFEVRAHLTDVRDAASKILYHPRLEMGQRLFAHEQRQVTVGPT